MDKQFYSTNNFTILQQVLNDKLEQKYNVGFDQVSSKKELFNIMNHVYKKHGNTAPSVTFLNKKIIDVCLPLFNKQLSNQIKEQTPVTTTPHGLPFPQNTLKRDIDLEKEYEERRSQLQEFPVQHTMHQSAMPQKPKKPLSFREPDEDKPIDPDKLYQEALNRRNDIPLPLDEYGNPINPNSSSSLQEQILQVESEYEKQVMGEHNPLDGHFIGDMQENVLDTDIRVKKSDDPHNMFKMMSEGPSLEEQRNQNSGIDQNLISMFNKAKEEEVQKRETENFQFKNSIITPPNVTEQRKKVHYITIDSRDRDLEVYPNPNIFQVKFGPASNSRVQGIYRDKNNNVIYDASNITIEGERGATIPNVLNNIRSIQCEQAIVPHTPTYVCGTCPYYYNSFQIDQNKVTSDDQFTSYKYGPINQVEAGSNDVIGIYTNVLDEPYLLLCIDELDQSYNGTNTGNRNAFAKLVHDNYYGTLTAFVQMRTAESEPFYYEPSPLGKLDKMTMRLLKCNALPYDFGRDKLYVYQFSEGDNCVTLCGTTSKTTKVTIVSNSSIYTDTNTEEAIVHYEASDDGSCGTANTAINHCLKPGNKIYFYDTYPCDVDTINFHPNVVIAGVDPLVINSSGSGVATDYVVTAYVDPNGTGPTNVEYVNFGVFLDIDDYLLINNVPYLVKATSTTSVTIRKFYTGQPDPDAADLSSVRFSFAKKVRGGIKSKNRTHINYIDGWRVCSAYDPSVSGDVAKHSFEIDYPYSWLPDRLKTTGDLDDTHYEAFFIKHQLQLSYTFKITTIENNFMQLRAEIV